MQIGPRGVHQIKTTIFEWRETYSMTPPPPIPEEKLLSTPMHRQLATAASTAFPAQKIEVRDEKIK